ncbi:ectoine/hydroxyectoine ABC transporter substrate-binding protein EhuB (plasmid) [Rhizobium bangladeshense]|uniref:ectoine/hydroxyectoine ABC transporter substrate-binding protein EhuB n=1 Tax=Rhizobium bangladeshense TaxID=1138189 RepID=UPI001A98BAE2|nr:ectoine/hydroxyectoine ABC transporter substrate-binding protein EhuB [Rhizobium bangladeshense]QSY97854.1 ectoine/hydroxyectoine ABC transporter substrate-binding protein EhuB [Rhizobium bangladeshense]
MRNTLKLAAALLLLTQASVMAEGLLDQVKAGGAVRVGFAEQEPFISTGPNGQLTGYEVDLLSAVISKIGPSKLEAVPTQFGALIPGLQAKRFDVVASDLYIRPDRCKIIAFAEPTHIVNDGLIVLAGNPKNIHSYADIVKDPTIKVGYIAGGGPIADHAIAAGVSKDQLSTLPDFNSLLAAVKTKRIDAFLNTGISISSVLKAANDTSVERAEPFEQAVIDGKPANATGSYAFRTEDQPFVDEFNKHLAMIVASGEAVKIGEKYGFAASDIPDGKVKTADLCK